jgi:hypothetical protein
MVPTRPPRLLVRSSVRAASQPRFAALTVGMPPLVAPGSQRPLLELPPIGVVRRGKDPLGHLVSRHMACAPWPDLAAFAGYLVGSAWALPIGVAFDALRMAMGALVVVATPVSPRRCCCPPALASDSGPTRLTIFQSAGSSPLFCAS